MGMNPTCLYGAAFYTHTHTQPFNGRWSRTTQVGRYQKKLAHSHPSWSSDILHQLPPFTTIHSILWVQFTCLTILFDNLFPGPLWSSSWSWTLYFILHHFFTQSLSYFHSTCPYQRSLFCCNTNAMSSIPSLSLSSLLGNLSFSLVPLIRLTILISARWITTTFSFLTGQVSLPCNMLLRTQLLYNLPLIINDMSLLVSNGTNCLNQFEFWPPQLHQHLHPHSVFCTCLIFQFRQVRVCFDAIWMACSLL